LDDFADIAGIETVFIDKGTNLRALKNEIRWDDVYYQLNDK
jgi:L-arabinose isomerase